MEKERLYVRVLPSKEALDLCEKAQIPHSHILALQGPFTTALNIALMEQYHIGHPRDEGWRQKGRLSGKTGGCASAEGCACRDWQTDAGRRVFCRRSLEPCTGEPVAKGGAGGYAQLEDNAASGRAKLSTAVEQEQHVYDTKGGAVE